MAAPVQQVSLWCAYTSSHINQLHRRGQRATMPRSPEQEYLPLNAGFLFHHDYSSVGDRAA
jgi:hypothetical protein